MKLLRHYLSQIQSIFLSPIVELLNIEIYRSDPPNWMLQIALKFCIKFYASTSAIFSIALTQPLA
jgi:hypothetical protein